MKVIYLYVDYHDFNGKTSESHGILVGNENQQRFIPMTAENWVELLSDWSRECMIRGHHSKALNHHTQRVVYYMSDNPGTIELTPAKPGQ